MQPELHRVNVRALLGRDADDLHDLTFSVDATSFYTVLPPDLVVELRLPAMMRASVAFRGRTIAAVPIGVAYLKLMDREGGVPFGVLDVSEPLLGSTALEALGLKLDEAQRGLAYASAYGTGALLLDEEDF